MVRFTIRKGNGQNEILIWIYLQSITSGIPNVKADRSLPVLLNRPQWGRRNNPLIYKRIIISVGILCNEVK